MPRGIEFRCPHCSATVRVPVELAGQAGRCPFCERMLRVPETESNVDLSSQSARNPFTVSEGGLSLPAEEEQAKTWVDTAAAVLEFVAVGAAPLVPCAGLVLGLLALGFAKARGRPLALPAFAVGLSLVLGLIYGGVMFAIQQGG